MATPQHTACGSIGISGASSGIDSAQQSQRTAPTSNELREAFEALAACSPNLRRMTFEQAQAHEVWARVIDCKARALRTARYRATTTRRVSLVRRVNPRTGTWHTQRVPGAFDDDNQPLLAQQP